MALFGAPIAHEDHTHRALSAALAIQRSSSRAADVRRPWNRIPDADGNQHRAGRGRRDRQDLRMDYTAVGDTTNLAARLLGIAKPGQSW